MGKTVKVDKKELERLRKAVVAANTLVKYVDRKLKEIEKLYHKEDK